MAKLSSLRQNTTRINDGDWVAVQTEGGEIFRIRTRGATPQYQYRLAALQRAAALEFNRNVPPGGAMVSPDTLPAPLSNRCFGNAMADETFIDVDGLEGDGGQSVTADEFREMLRRPDEYLFLIVFALQALGVIQAGRQEAAQDAMGNSGNALPGA